MVKRDNTDRQKIAESLFGILPSDVEEKCTRSVGDRSYLLAPRMKLYVTPNGWYTLEWDFPEGEQPNFEKAIKNLEMLIEYGDIPPAATPRKYIEDSYPSAEAVLADLKGYKTGSENGGCP